MGMVSMLVIETVVTTKFSSMIMNWVNDENPEGKPMMGSHLILSIAYVGGDQYDSELVFCRNFHAEARENIEDDHRKRPWARLFFLFLIATTGKVVGTMIYDVMLGFRWLESVAIGLLLNIKGHFHVYLATIAAKISRGTTDPGMMVFVTDMIKLTNRIAATLGHIDGVEAVMVTDPTVMDMREEITRAMEGYVEVDGEGIIVRRMLALATLNNMHQDICIMAEELMVSMVGLPFHKDQKTDGRLSIRYSGFQHVN
ncbi:hypothetical protein U1Q18_014351 [Sarracenia purpurea var. burkii]